MFYITDFDCTKHTISQKIKRIFVKPNPKVIISRFENIQYGIVKGDPFDNPPFFFRLKEMIGDDVLIFQENFDLTKRNRKNRAVFPHPILRSPDRTEYYQRLLVNFTLEICKSASKSERVKLLLVDIGGNCAGVCIELLKVAHSVFVYTENPKRYDGCTKYAQQTLGTAPVIIGRQNSADKVSVILAPYGMGGFVHPYPSTPTISLKKSDNGFYITEDGIVFDKHFFKDFSHKISPVDIASQIFIEREYFTNDRLAFLRQGNNNYTKDKIVNLILNYRM